jgi:hypothetical protein
VSFHRVLRGTEESLDLQMLLEPLEEQFYLPTTAMKLSDGKRRQLEVVGEKHQGLAFVGLEPNPAQ